MEVSVHRIQGSGEVSEAITSRILRGLDHHAEFGAERIGEGIYLVPSSTGRGSYRVEVSLSEAEDGADHCVCPDFSRNGRETGLCRHTIAALIAEAKLYAAEAREDLEACYTGLERLPEIRYGLELGPVYDAGEALVNVFEYEGDAKRLITTTGSVYAAERDVAALRAGGERGRELLARAAEYERTVA